MNNVFLPKFLKCIDSFCYLIIFSDNSIRRNQIDNIQNVRFKVLYNHQERRNLRVEV